MKIVGYIRWLQDLSETDMNDLQSKLFRAAHARGLDIFQMFWDDPEGQRVFDIAISGLAREGERFLFVPGLHHLVHIGWGSPLDVVKRLEYHGVDVIIVP